MKSKIYSRIIDFSSENQSIKSKERINVINNLFNNKKIFLCSYGGIIDKKKIDLLGFKNIIINTNEIVVSINFNNNKLQSLIDLLISLENEIYVFKHDTSFSLEDVLKSKKKLMIRHLFSNNLIFHRWKKFSGTLFFYNDHLGYILIYSEKPLLME
ncbi:hypothetical protein H2O64_15410 [Kordia sp. YSTF-M3]|uniref:Uncharacterized protein n=1 Tax=Kordia aestuariivivens TaxID=2759037 RepID=A0ABR7QCJ2_9FLAO|nr:hypothetical protein [Kordia aestuariivivens]MBC8756064.1 hypothetical protein [Kordia aestuariivivens]